jgi:predicted 3-demethylubiquinone-9 3-methyltransferase (glyoxalase superfamily)
MAQKIIPCLWFNDHAEEAANFYVSLFNNAKIANISRYGKAGAEVAKMPEGSVLTVDFTLEGKKLVALNGGPVFKFTPALSLYIGCDTAAEVDSLYTALSEKGVPLMPLDKYPFSQRYAWITDRYGVSWQLFLGPYKQKITPCLMFTQIHYGKAREAMTFYVSIFNKSKMEMTVPYEKNEGEKEGALKHAVFSLEGERFIAMDSGLQHTFTFTPAISFMVVCANQKEIDHFWKRLSAVPEAEQCGWLQDKYGISWQIVPDSLETMTNDKTRSEKAMKALFQMKKLDIKTLRQAFERK